MITNVTLHKEEGYIEYKNLRSALADARVLAVQGYHVSVRYTTTWNLSDIIAGYEENLSSQKKHWISYSLCNRNGDVVCTAQSKHQAFDFALQSYRKSMECRIFKIVETKRYGVKLLTCDKWNKAQIQGSLLNKIKAVYRILQENPKLNENEISALRDISRGCHAIMKNHRIPLNAGIKEYAKMNVLWGINEYKVQPVEKAKEWFKVKSYVRDLPVNGWRVHEAYDAYIIDLYNDCRTNPPNQVTIRVPKFEGMESHLVKGLSALVEYIKHNHKF